MRRQLIRSITISVAAVAAASLANAPASAYDYKGCWWPRVCFYKTAVEWNNATPNAAYKDVTSYYQELSPAARGADHVRNTRNDDRAWLRYFNNWTGVVYYTCLNPNEDKNFPDPNFVVTGIMIQWEPTCPPE